MKAINQDILEQMQTLHEQIAHYNHLHFVENKSEISDEEFDALMRELNTLKATNPKEARELEKKSAVIPLSGGGTELELARLEEKMLSLNKVYNQGELDIFMKQQPEGATFSYEYKLDGLALELNYVNGVLKEILTRYDGSNGELVTHALPLFNNIPLEVPEWRDVPSRRVRGEGYINYANFARYNEVSTLPAKNTRNSVAGWVRALPQNQNPLAKGLLSFNTYWCDADFGKLTYDEVMDELVKLGFERAPKITELYIENNVRSTVVPVDGVVIKVNELALQKKQGNRSNSPRWAIAYKFPAETAETRLTDVVWQVGRTGAVTPVIQYSPIMLMGAECSRATIHNYRRFINHGLRIGSRVLISRNGDVIPHLAKVIDNGNGKIIHAPKACPSCGALLSYEGENDEAIHLRCNNVASCPAQLAQRCYNLVDKDGLDIDGIGLVTITKWIEEGLVKNPADIFRLPESATNPGIYTRIHAARQVPLNKFIKALSLPSVGVVTAMNIAKAVGDYELPYFLTQVELLAAIPDIGPGTAMEIANAAQDPEFVKLLTRLLEEVSLIPPKVEVYTCKAAISGSTSMPRSELEDIFRESGIEITNKVTKDCKVMLVGQRPSNPKVAKANKFGLPVIDVVSVPDIQALIERILA
ncbi:putative NAD dependent DNA ligase [Erwinia phage vB_EamM_Joad]|uniref:DNA ligase (NAD(+)) n=1 Tax=Erwinia phage vB_EamM_Joad TaxID=2026081 RepID=A0A223LHC3_9CAUD|nr:putative NAD dependent DNA ligase [Erwinia phage vB_EamM_Joad]